jgi:hypothetical protein
MGRIWDLSKQLRGKGVLALFVTTAVFAVGAQALTPSVASAWQIDFCDPDCMEGGPGTPAGDDGGTDEGGTTDNGAPTDNSGTTGNGGTVGNGPATSDAANPPDPFQQLRDLGSTPTSPGNPLNPDPLIDSLVRLQPGLPGLNEAVLKALDRKGLLDTTSAESIVNGVLNLVNDCSNIATDISALGERRVTLEDAIDLLGDTPRADRPARRLGRVKGDIREDQSAYRYMACGKVRW